MPGQVLVLDYTGNRPEPPLESLGLESDGFSVRYLIDEPYVRELTAPDYATALITQHGPFGADTIAVLAYCMAAPIAQELIAIVSARTGQEIPMILFDAEPVTVQAIQSEYQLAGRKLAGLLSLPPAEAAVPGTVDDAALRDSPAKVLDAMHEDLLRLGEKAARLKTVDPEDAWADAELVADFYRDWLAHLVAGYNTTWPAWWGEVFHIVSRDHPAQCRWPGASGTQTIRLPSARHDLVLHPDTKTTVLSVLRKQAQ